MTKLLRALSLATLLSVAALSAPEAAPLGTCRTLCYGTGFPPTSVTWSTTYQECCGGDQNPCPPGTTPRAVSYNNNRCGI